MLVRETDVRCPPICDGTQPRAPRKSSAPHETPPDTRSRTLPCPEPRHVVQCTVHRPSARSQIGVSGPMWHRADREPDTMEPPLSRGGPSRTTELHHRKLYEGNPAFSTTQPHAAGMAHAATRRRLDGRNSIVDIVATGIGTKADGGQGGRIERLRYASFSAAHEPTTNDIWKTANSLCT